MRAYAEISVGHPHEIDGRSTETDGGALPPSVCQGRGGRSYLRIFMVGSGPALAQAPTVGPLTSHALTLTCATALLLTKAFPPRLAMTSTSTFWAVPVQSKAEELPAVDPVATSFPTFSVRLIETFPDVGSGPEQVTVTETSTPAPLATSVAGEFTATCS